MIAGRWLLHVGDAYYLRVELSTDDHPVTVVELFGYHDFSEFPAGTGQ